MPLFDGVFDERIHISVLLCSRNMNLDIFTTKMFSFQDVVSDEHKIYRLAQDNMQVPRYFTNSAGFDASSRAAMIRRTGALGLLCKNFSS
jgi:hypothetical protein